MSKALRVAFLPLRYIWILGIALALGLGTGLVDIPGTASAQVALDECATDRIDNQCVQEQVDVCWNLEGDQEDVPEGYVIDESQDNACVEEDEEPEPQVLGESSTNSPQPTVLAESAGAATAGK